MSSQSKPQLVSKSPDFISIDKTVVANIDQLHEKVCDAAMLMEITEVLDRTGEEDCGTLYRLALEKMNETFPIFSAVFDAIGQPGDRS